MAEGIDNGSSNEEKVALFRELFFGRQDVYARRFENAKSGRSGYSPECANKWKRGVCGLPHVKCGQCGNRQFAPITDEVVRAHLRGRDMDGKPFVMGVYPMQENESVRFAALDFDESSWRRDVSMVVKTVRKLGLPVALERSRSGKGAHLWFFLDEDIAARTVRAALTYLLTVTLEEHPEIGLSSYDRIIPCQDTLPKGGIGNLIALPLQREPRQVGNSVFVNDDLVPLADQWAFLSSVRRVTREEIETLQRKGYAEHRLLLPQTKAEGCDDRPWEFFAPLWGAFEPPQSIPTEVAAARPVEVVLSNRVYIAQEPLTQTARSELIRVASFVNPEFYEAQRMCLSVFGKPRVITRAFSGEKYLELPRGCLESAREILERQGYRLEMSDKRYSGVPLDVSFNGELRPMQKDAAKSLAKFDTGILAAGTAFGKTVLAAWMIAHRKVNTLILVNRKQLQLQWVSRLSQFLGIPEKEIGRIGGGANRWTGRIDVALLQSMGRKGVVDPRIREYGQIVVDECHGIAAETFTEVADAAPCRYVLGLSATVMRKDGHHPLIMMLCGPVRHSVDPKALAKIEPFDHLVQVKVTNFRPEVKDVGEDGEADYLELCREIVADSSRNRAIVADVLSAVAEGRSPVVLTERREHLDILSGMLEGRVDHLIVLKGGMGRKELKGIESRLREIPGTESRVILATGSFLGEGFDDSRLDTLFLAMPVSWKGKITQYAGRLHRLHDGKREVRIVDYLDSEVAMFARMFDRRAKGYEAIGYRVTVPVGAKEGWPIEVAFPAIPHWQETFAESVRRLCRDGVDVALADLFVAATLKMTFGEELTAMPETKDAVVSFLLKRLDSLDGQKGKYRRDVRLPIPFGTNPYLQVDLCSEAEKKVIFIEDKAEIAKPAEFRRARRQDVLLQAGGYKVFRFLAEDVCEDLASVLDGIQYNWGNRLS